MPFKQLKRKKETNKQALLLHHSDYYHEDGKGIAINGDLFVHYLTLAS